jgi:SAM-dependent methyltransferase
MLAAAKSRLIKLNGKIPANMVFLQGDVLQLPFKPKSFGTVISLNLLHILGDEDLKRALQGLRNSLLDGGTISFTTLIENDRFADRYLLMLGNAGKVVRRNANQFFGLFDELGIPVKYRIEGNLIFGCYR